MSDETLGNDSGQFQQELRRGTVVLAALLALRDPGYGYGLLATLNDAGVAVEANTLYPLLRRLERQGYLTSLWNTDETRPRKFYRTTAAGDALSDQLLANFDALQIALHLLKSERKETS